MVPPDDALLGRLVAAFAPHGLNLVGATSIAAYDAGVPHERALRHLAPDAVSAVVVGNGGGEFWSAFRAHCAAHPAHARLVDPLDVFTAAVVDEVVAAVCGGVAARVVYPFRFAAEPVSFMRLAACAGLGRPGLVGVLLHPVYGPWIALRAAVLVPFAVAAPRPADGFDPCPGCGARTCIAACPARAVGDAGWDVPTCAAHRDCADDPCATRCHARVACVVGPEHRYPDEALAFHQGRARAAVLAPALAPGPSGGLLETARRTSR